MSEQKKNHPCEHPLYMGGTLRCGRPGKWEHNGKWYCGLRSHDPLRRSGYPENSKTAMLAEYPKLVEKAKYMQGLLEEAHLLLGARTAADSPRLHKCLTEINVFLKENPNA